MAVQAAIVVEASKVFRMAEEDFPFAVRKHQDVFCRAYSAAEYI
jgi:hypothetical protein